VNTRFKELLFSLEETICGLRGSKRCAGVDGRRTTPFSACRFGVNLENFRIEFKDSIGMVSPKLV
jgi:hypothetical protein